MGEWINKMEYLAIKREKLGLRATTWRGLRTLCWVQEASHEGAQAVRLVSEMCSIGKSLEAKISDFPGLEGGKISGKGKWGLMSKRVFWGVEMFWTMIAVMVTQLWIY